MPSFTLFILAAKPIPSWKSVLSESRDAAGLQKKKKTGNVLLSQAASHQVSSALRSLTSVFEMGTGVASPLLSPDFLFFSKVCTFKTEYIISCIFKNHWSSVRPISIGQLNALLHLHLRPINVVVFHGSYLNGGNLILWGASHLDAFSAYPFHT